MERQPIWRRIVTTVRHKFRSTPAAPKKEFRTETTGSRWNGGNTKHGKPDRTIHNRRQMRRASQRINRGQSKPRLNLR